MKLKVQILFIVAIVTSVVSYIKLSNDLQTLIIVTVLVTAFFPLSMLITKLQWNFFEKINRAPIINMKVNWLLVGAYICSILSIFLSIVIYIKGDKNSAYNLLKIPGLNLGYLIIFSIKKTEQ